MTKKENDKTWGPGRSFGFKGHCPYFLRHSSGAIFLAHRLPATSLHWTADADKMWNGPVQIDTVVGAYPSLVELPDGLVYCVYYEEGKGVVGGSHHALQEHRGRVEGMRAVG